ncbi:MAG: pyruvate kinase [Kiritimatiellae bacterium]|nr:pyruvate kinase [Verrucomicrobiota bacterium]MBU4291991.1 pyruvate kinase [Verrucomicrobiota bacterium]MCG2678825.1 pyruvate kinase [Kiritimatiellia bacterium]
MLIQRQETKILATLGPASFSPEMIRALILKGTDGFRINMSHEKAGDLAARVQAVRSAAAQENAAVAVVVDLGGPKIRVGTLPNGQINLVDGGQPILGADIPVSHPEILTDIRPGHRILMDDGKLELEVLGVVPNGVKTRVRVGGLLLQGKGVNLPDTELRLPALTDKDIEDLAAAVRAEADYVSLSFVQRPGDLLLARREAERHGRCPLLIAKIEKPQAVDRFEEILKVSDGVMVARGDLGVEVSPARVPVLQKHFISRCNAQGKTVITATQMLESMIQNPRPTRAEASDVANAVWDGTDAVMLSGETAIGRYPLECVGMMRDIIAEAEKAAPHRREPFPDATRVHALASAAVDAAEELHARAIVIITLSGFTAQMVAQRRPSVPLIAVVPELRIRNRLALVWGILPVIVPWGDNSDGLLAGMEKILVASGYIQLKDTIIIISGSTRLRGADYIMKIQAPSEP